MSATTTNIQDSAITGAKRLILIFDDQMPETMQVVYQVVIDSLGEQYAIKIIDNPVEATTRIGQAPAPALALVDVLFPEKSDGLAICKLLRDWIPGPELQIIALTANDPDPDTAAEFLRDGADDYLRRDIYTPEALDRIRRRLVLQEFYTEMWRQYDEFARDANHTIANLLQVVTLEAEFLEPREPTATLDREAIVNHLRDSRRRISAAREALHALTEVLRETGIQRRPFGPGDEVVRAINLARSLHPDASLQLMPAGVQNAVATGYPKFFFFAIFELLRNAITMGATARDVRVTVETQAQRSGANPRYIIDIRDNGPGIPISIRGHEWEQGVHSRTDGSGTGLGLYFVKRQITACGGDATTVATDSTGTHIRLNIPLLP